MSGVAPLRGVASAFSRGTPRVDRNSMTVFLHFSVLMFQEDGEISASLVLRVVWRWHLQMLRDECMVLGDRRLAIPRGNHLRTAFKGLTQRPILPPSSNRDSLTVPSSIADSRDTTRR